MADIFVSYKRNERERVEPLVRFLEQQGFSVFWDLRIPPGQYWDTWISQNLVEAKCIVVVWTKSSVTAQWVKEEASQGRDRKNLVPIRLDAVEPPFGFSMIQAADLTKWKGQLDDPELAKLVPYLQEKLGIPGRQQERVASKEAKKNRASSVEGAIKKFSATGEAKLSFRIGVVAKQKRCLHLSKDILVVGNNHRRRIHDVRISGEALKAIKDFESIYYIPQRRIEVLHCPGSKAQIIRDKALSILRKEYGVRFVECGLCTTDGRWIVYSNNIFVLLDNTLTKLECSKFLAEYNVTLNRDLPHAKNFYLASVPDTRNEEVFHLAADLLTKPEIILCYPEIFRNPMAFAQQWHLQKTRIKGKIINQHASVKSSWELSKGEGITIAVLSKGIDLLHEEFTGTDKIVTPKDFINHSNEEDVSQNDYGTAMAGLACANGHYGAAGVAPSARLMPIQVSDANEEGLAIRWAAEKGADVICLSSGPPSGNWWDPRDPSHRLDAPLLDSTLTGIDFSIEYGRGGKGCIIVVPVGTGNESADRDELVSYNKVIAVAACNAEGEEKRL